MKSPSLCCAAADLILAAFAPAKGLPFFFFFCGIVAGYLPKESVQMFG